MDTWGSMSCCTMAWGSADGLEKLKMKHDSNLPEASTDQIRQNNRRGSSSGATENTGFCPWLGSDIAGGGGAVSPSSQTASFFSSSGLQGSNASLMFRKPAWKSSQRFEAP